MPPPASFIDITTTPFSRVVTTVEFNASNLIWFRLVTASDIAAGFWTSQPGGASLLSRIYQSDGTTLITSLSTSSGVWWDLPAGTYYIKVERFPSSAIAADFTFEFDSRPMDPSVGAVPDGTVLIPDDSNTQLAAIILGPDGTVYGFDDDIPTGEIGDSLPSRYFLIHDRFGRYAANSCVLFGPTLALIATVTFSPALSGWPFIINDGTYFYVIDSTSGAVFRVTSAGVVTGPIATIPFSGTPNAVGISRDADVLYWVESGNAGIQQYRISTGVTSTLYTIPGFQAGIDDTARTFNSNPGDIIVLPDGSLVTWWIDDSAGDQTILLHVAADGTFLNSIPIALDDFINHLHYASATASTHIKLWLFVDFGVQSRIGDFNLSTGVFDSSFLIDTFAEGQSADSLSNTKFGPSSSCPFMSFLATSADPPTITSISLDGEPIEDTTICLQFPTLTLFASVTGDDGLGRQWTKESGPGTVTFGSSTAALTTATFSAAGVYILRFAATNGAASAFLEVTITVEDCPCVGIPMPLVHQWFDQGGDPAHDYKLYTYAAGSEVPLPTYHDQQLTIPNPNPMVLDSAARARDFYVEAGVYYRMVMKDRDGNTIWERDDWAWAPTDAAAVAAAAAEIKPGSISMFAGASDAIPAGWLLCDGAAHSRSTYQALFNAIGTTYGPGNGSTTFNVPDFRGRIPFGLATSGTGSVLGQTAGQIDHVHTGPSHTHTIPPHQHTMAHTHSVPRDGWDGQQAVGTGTDGRLLANDGAATNLTEAQADNTSGASSAANTGSQALTTAEGGTSNTGAANPPILGVFIIVKT